MDNLPSTQVPPKTVPPIQSSFLKTTKGKIIILVFVVILLAIAAYILNYFNLLPFSKKPATLNQAPAATQKLTLSCPVPKEFCTTGKIIRV